MFTLRLAGLCLVLVLQSPFYSGAHEPVTRARTPIQLPDLPGFVTLKCDFHTHTVFSDGYVWPTIRVEEAWRNGLDAIAITDHLEYQPHKADITTNHNRSFEVAAPTGKDLNVLVVKGSEITRSMPPGHLNAIFLKDSEALAVPDWRDAIAAAHEQEAFIFWNHPGSGIKSPDGKNTWYPEHDELLKKGMLHGIEVANGRRYYPEAHRWAIEHNLTMLSNTDIHNPAGHDYPAEGYSRPTTLVFAKERTTQALKEALRAHRTVVYFQNQLIGDEQFLRPIFDRSVTALNPVLGKGNGRKLVQIRNTCDVEFELDLVKGGSGIEVPDQVKLAAGKVVLLQITGDRDPGSELNLHYKVKNMLCGPDKPMEITLRLEVQK